MKRWSRKWKSSKQPRKQRKYRRYAPLSVRHKLMSAHLSKELRQKYKKRSFPLRKGDEVELMRGKFKKRTGKVIRIDLNKLQVYIEGVTRKKVAGTEVQIPFRPNVLKIINLNLDDKERVKALERTIKK